MKKPPAHRPGEAISEDAALFRAVVGEVIPLAEQNRIAPQPAPRKPLLRTSAASPAIPDTLSDSGAENAPDEFLSNGLSRMTLRKLRRGNWPIQNVLDLHGNNSEAARKLLQEFLHDAAQNALRCVLVIHGKGMNSQGGEAVLRKLARHWLTQHPRVLAYCDAPPKDGGHGAVLVLLKVS
ncbi:MAG: Smr/MutS family protein [Gallionellaceae bacterium]|nr:Smr/MutS family protein [Gallionellaceae bacterium]